MVRGSPAATGYRSKAVDEQQRADDDDGADANAAGFGFGKSAVYLPLLTAQFRKGECHTHAR
jgi:hypothetical protein